MVKTIAHKSVPKLAYYYAIRNKKLVEYHENLYRHFSDENQVAQLSSLIVETYQRKIDAISLQGQKPIPTKIKQEIYDDLIVPQLYQNGLTKEQIDAITYKTKNLSAVPTIDSIEKKAERKVLRSEDVTTHVDATEQEVEELFNTFDSSKLNDDGEEKKVVEPELASNVEMDDMFNAPSTMEDMFNTDFSTNEQATEEPKQELITDSVKESFDDVADDDFIVKEVPQENTNELDDVQPSIAFN